MQDYWYLPVDKNHLKGDFVSIVPEMKPLESFEGFLDRKFHTYNTANGTAAYLGYLKGKKYIWGGRLACGDRENPRRGVRRDIGGSLPETQIRAVGTGGFCRELLRNLRDQSIVDYVERNARDPIRKLGLNDRLAGPARLAQSCGIRPGSICMAIAAALFYDEPTDPYAVRLAEMRRIKGVPHVLDTICHIGTEEDLFHIITKKMSVLEQRGWIKEKVT